MKKDFIDSLREKCYDEKTEKKVCVVADYECRDITFKTFDNAGIDITEVIFFHKHHSNNPYDQQLFVCNYITDMDFSTRKHKDGVRLLDICFHSRSGNKVLRYSLKYLTVFEKIVLLYKIRLLLERIRDHHKCCNFSEETKLNLKNTIKDIIAYEKVLLVPKVKEDYDS